MMSLFDILLISIGLGMDCFAVSLAQGLGADDDLCGKDVKPVPFSMAILFGFFQGVMPLIGYLAGTTFSSFFSIYAPWIALILLSVIGGKMIVENFRPKDKTEPKVDWSVKHLFVLAIATSIDALATGVIFIPCPHMLQKGLLTIGMTSFCMSLVGFGIGARVGRLKIKAGLIGGIILICIGLKIWIEGFFLQ